MEKLLEGKRVLVTGSSKGIGFAVGKSFVDQGAKVAFNSRNDPEGEFKELLDSNENCFHIKGDLSTKQGAAEVVSEAYKLLGGLDCLINNAGTFVGEHFMDVKETSFDKMLKLNVEGYYFAAQNFANLVVKKGFDAKLEKPYACIINTGSINGIMAEHNSSAYDTTKGAILMMTRSLAFDLADRGIRVNCVAPGLIDTPLTHNDLNRDPGLTDRLADRIPMKKIGTPADVTGAYIYLASELADYVTGQTIYVDGGIMIAQTLADIR